MHSAIMTRISILQLLFCAATFLTQSTVAEDAGAIDTRICFSSLITADANNDRELNKTEYITFLKIYGLPDMQVDKYVDLPLVLQSTFTLLSCICRSNGSSGSSCCVGPEAYIPTDGAADFEMPTPDQVTYLYRLCKVTDNAVDQATPTEDPTLSSSPTMASASPTLFPSGQPSVSPSEIPSVEPTISSANPSASLVPTLSPSNPQTTVGSESPTFENMVDAVIRTTYSISIVNGKRDAIKPASYIPDLIKAMDTVATEVAVLVEGDLGGNDMNRRKLAVTVELPTSITLIADQEWSDKGSTSVGCSTELGNPKFDGCQEITASIRLFLDDEDGEDVYNLFSSTLDEEIAKGRLHEALMLTNPDSAVVVLTGADSGGGEDSPTIAPAAPNVEAESGLSTGETVGIAAAGVVLLAIIIVSITKSKGENGNTTRRQDDGKFVEATPSEELKMSQRGVGSGLEWQTPKPTDTEQPSMGGTPWVKPGQKQKKTDEGSEISDENSAGWSDAYSSSMGTNDSDENAEDLLAAAGIEGGDNSAENVGIANMDQLEAAITAGNWAAVGASAAMLAASQYDTDSRTDSRSNSKSSMSYSAVGSSIQSLSQRELDGEKTRELDNLIQTGDWEGIIQAAARFEAEINQDDQSATIFEDNDSQTDSRSGSRSGSLNSGSVFSSSIQPSSAVSETQDPPPNQEEYRKEVHDLVSRVVPEELEHVDDMIAQFKGRENELLETLRTMQERNVAQKAKKTDQQKAKMEAKRMVAKAKKEAKSRTEEDEEPEKQESNDDAAASAAADWAIAQALSNLEKGESYDDQSNVVPDEDFDDEGSL